MAGNAPWDPMDGDIDWNRTGYGTGGKETGFWKFFGDAMPWVVGGGLAAGAIAPLVAGAGSAAAAAPAASTGAGATGGGNVGFWGSIGKFFNSPGGQVATDIAGKLIGGKMQSDAANRATDAQAQAAREALAFEKGVYDKDVADYDRGLGTLAGPSTVRLGEFLNQRATPRTAGDVFAAGNVSAPPAARTGPPMMSINQMRSGGPMLSPGGSAGFDEKAYARPEAGAPMMPTGGGMVKMQAPDGEVRLVKPESVAKYEAKGARRVA